MSFATNENSSIPGSYELKKIALKSQSGGEIDLDNLFLEMNIYEDIFNNIIYGKLTLAESLNLISNMPILEGDIVWFLAGVNINDPNMVDAETIRDEIDIELEVIRIDDRGTNKQDNNIYTLVLASSGWSDNHFSRVTKSYNMTAYSDMVQGIFDNYFQNGGISETMKKKKIEIEKTDGNYCFIFPSWPPLKCFNYLAERSYSEKAADWLFYEDIDQFRFVSINSRLAKEPVGEHYYFPSNINEGSNISDNVIKETYLNFHSVQYIEGGNMLESVNNGMISNRMIVFDIFNRTISDYWNDSSQSGGNYIIKDSFDYEENYNGKNHCDEGKHLAQGNIMNKCKNGRGQGKKTFVIENSSMWDNQTTGYDVNRWVRQRASNRQAIDYFKLLVTGWGLFSRTIGDVIKFKFDSPQVFHEEQDSKYDGNYLITAIRRTFTPTVHTMEMELSKDSIISIKENRFWEDGNEYKPPGKNSN